MHAATSVRPDWSSLPARVRAYAEKQLGAGVTKAMTCGAGYTPGLACRLQLADGRRAFLKGIDGDHPFAPQYRSEVEITPLIPEGIGPKVLWSTTPEEGAGWWLLCLEDLPGGNPTLAPGSAATAAVIEAVEKAGKALTPAPLADAEPITKRVGSWLTGWANLAASPTDDLDPWAVRNLDRLAEAEPLWQSAAGGETFIHWDLRPDNFVLRADGTAVIIDWSYPHKGARWIDPAVLIPQLIMAGHTASEAEKAVAHLPMPSPEVLTSFAIALCGYWEISARRPNPPGVPFLREHQARAATVARAWIAHRTRWA
ncbi:phosphotransferase [Streptomyces sp. CT34]|uniref:phosphotransferase family protein n=1 Tax=Streptomyces sp. CT34 TaxID=1553907 RepID=UPI00099C461A|nr:phosphotransferase [Streptomyces sp. CT34]